MFSKNLKKYRLLAGYPSAKSFADALNIQPTTYVNYENGQREPKYETLCKIAAALHVSIDDLLGFNGTADPVERGKQLVKMAGFKLAEVSPPGCVTVIMDTPDFIAKKYPSLSGGQALAFSNDDFLRWVDSSMAQYEAEKPKLAHKVFYSVFMANLIAGAALFNNDGTDRLFSVPISGPLSESTLKALEQLKAQKTNKEK